MISGMQAAAKPTPSHTGSAAEKERKKLKIALRKSGIATLLASSHEGLSPGQVGAEEQVETLIGLGDDVVDLRRAAAALDRFEEARQLVEVSAAEGTRVTRYLAVVFEILDARDVVEREIHLRRVEHLEDDHLVLLVAKVLQGADQLGGVVEQVGQDNYERAALERLGELVERRGQAGLAAGVGVFQ